MRGFVLAQLRRGGGRLVAAGIAIALGSAFVAAALLGSDIVKQTAYNSVSASFAEADLVLTSGTGFSPETVESIGAVTGVEAVSPVQRLSFVVANEGRSDYAWASVTASDERLEPATVESGRLPGSDGELALTASSAKRLGLAVGDVLTVSGFDESEGTARTATLVGTLVDPTGFNYDAPTAVVTEALATDLASAIGVDLYAERALVVLEDARAASRVSNAIEAEVQGVNASTVDEAAHAAVVHFAGVALVVAAIVIANTFQVLVDQRAQMLALLRCVGATRSQVRRSVLIEAGAVGLVASAAGLGLGTLLAQTALWVVPALDLAVPAPSVVTLSAATVAWPLATGTAVTVLAALAPARLATRVAPLAALRPLELTPVRKSSRVRLVLALLGVVVGGGILALATFAALTFDQADPTLFVLAGIFGGAVSITGVLVGAVYFVPGVARMLGYLAARAGGVPGKVAAANSVRNPRRTTATASALLIGAGLVTMMATGAATARGSLASLLDENFPVDVAVQAPWNASGVGSLTATQVAAVESTDGVARTEPVEAITVTVVAGGDTWSDETAYTASAEGIRAVSRTGAVELPEPGTTAVPAWMDVKEGETITVTLGEKSVELVNDPEVTGQLWLAEEDLARLGGETVTTALWVSLEPDADPRDVTSNLRDTFTELSSTVGDPPAEILGAAVERAGYEEVIDTLLAIVVGLLGVAVVIALVGVANTLSLSVLERRRESATLRAIGLRKAQLRQMLAIEGVIIAVVGAALGAVLGIVYGWTGSALILGSSGGLRLAVPWRDLAIILAVAVAAGLLASVLPSRTATRTPPVAALAVD